MEQQAKGLGLYSLRLTADSRTVAYLACKQQAGKVKTNDLAMMGKIREAILHNVDIDADSGRTWWVDGVVTFPTEEHFKKFVLKVRNFLDSEGVDFDLSTGGADLLVQIDSKESELVLLKAKEEEQEGADSKTE